MRLLLVSIALVFLAPAGLAAPAQVRTDNHDDPHLHLFVDDAELEKVENLRRVINRPRKHPAPVLVADRPWEGHRAQAWGSVIVEPDGLLRMWYFAYNSRSEERRVGQEWRYRRMC